MAAAARPWYLNPHRQTTAVGTENGTWAKHDGETQGPPLDLLQAALAAPAMASEPERVPASVVAPAGPSGLGGRCVRGGSYPGGPRQRMVSLRPLGRSTRRW